MNKLNNSILYVIIVLLTRKNLCSTNPFTSANNHKEKEVFRNSYAEKMLSYMNMSVNPCDDFYEYACGNWNNVVKERRSFRTTLIKREIKYKLDDIFENILKRPHINDAAPEYAKEFQLAKQFYNSCITADLFPMRASPEYLLLLNKIGGFPALDADWKSENFHWLNMSAHLSNYGVKNFINENLSGNIPFRLRYQLPVFGFNNNLHNDTINNSSSNAYIENEKIMRNILSVYGAKKKHIDDTINEIFEFLKQVLNFMQTFKEDESTCANFTDLSASTEIMNEWNVYDDIAWLKKETKHLSLCYYFYKKFDEICENNKRGAANYLALKFIFHIDAGLDDSEFQKEYCFLHIKTSMIYFFDHLYMKLYFNSELHDEISNIIRDVRQSLRTIIKKAEWLDETTRNAAILKLFMMREYIGRYEDTNYTKLLIRELRKLQFVNGSYAANNLNLHKFAQYIARFSGRNIKNFGTTTKQRRLLVGSQVNAFNSLAENTIYVMAGILTEPVYHKAWPNSLKFGALGSVIGHELTHGFDTLGAHYDVDGTYNYWWSNKSANAFKERANCFVKHYNNYFVPEINRYIDGELSKNENIADNGGLRESLMAYRRLALNAEEEKMPGINLLPEQLFFLGFAQMRCSSYKPTDYLKLITDAHPIEKFRVLGTLSNSADFAMAYNCPLGSNMNPTSSKCIVW